MPDSTPSLADVLERARREKWTRLALLDPLRADEDSWRKQQLRDRGWPEDSIVVVTKVDIEIDDLIARVTQIESLKELFLDHPTLGDAGARAIAEHLRDLTSLGLEDNSIGEEGALSIALHLPALTSLNLAHNNIGYTGALAIAERLPALTSLNLAHNSIGKAGARAIAEHLPALTSLDLAYNRVGEAGARAIAQHLHALTSLNLAGNSIGEAGARAIAQHLPALTSLNLAHNSIGEAGAQAIAQRLPDLTALDLTDNSVGEAGARAVAQHLRDLTSLDLEDNRIGDAGAQVIAERLSALTSLNLAHTSIGEAGARAIAQHLHALTSLNLSSNNIDDAGAQAIAQHLHALTSLNLALSRIGEAGARAIAQHLPALTSLNLSGNGIDDAGAAAMAENLRALTALSLEYNAIGEAGARAIAERLPALTSLNLAGNRIGDAGARAIAEHLPALTALYLEGNEIGEAGARAIVQRLRHLRDLDLDANAIGSLPDEIGQLTNLRSLSLSKTELKGLPRTLLELRGLRTLLIHGNKRLNLPPELAYRESDAARILAWYFAQKRRLNEAKVLMVGQGGVGKTSLVGAVIHGRKADPDERKTEKIRIDTWAIPRRNEGETIRVNVWDFGGQEIMHATHQFFLTRRSVYVLVLDARQGEIEGNIHYWLQTIQSFGGDSPVLIVTNKCDVQPLTLNENGLKRQYAPMEIGFHSVSCATLDGIGRLREALTATIQGLAHVDDELPAAFFDVKAELERASRDRHYFEMADYARLCRERGIAEEREQRRLLRFLHDLGTVLNFDDPESPYQVGDTNILNPEWVTEAVYTIINNHSLMQAQGQLEWKRLPDILTDSVRYPRDKQRFIIEMMRKFELCFDFPDRPNTLLIPELLTKNEPDVNFRAAEECLNFEDAYAVLPSGLLPRFIVRMHHALTDKPTYWRSRVVLGIDGCKVLVRGDSRANVIRISVDGRPEARRGALATVRDQLKAIHKTIPRLEVEERVPLPDLPHVAVPYGYLLQLEELSRSRPDMDRFIPQGLRMGEVREYSARKLLSGIEVASGKPSAPPARKRPPDEDRGLDVFISYSSKDSKWKDDLITMLKPYTRREVMAVWHGRDIKSGEDWRREIDEALAKAKVGVLLVSKDFLASDFIMETELPHLMTAAEERGVKIGWMLIGACAWEQEKFPNFQALVGDLTKPLNRLPKPRRDAEMARIAKEIDALVRRARGDTE